MNPILELDGLSVRYRSSAGDVHALEDVSLRVERGETVGVVGESGSGKTTLARAIPGLLDPAAEVTGGSAWFDAVPRAWADADGDPRPDVVSDERYPVREDGMVDLVALSEERIRDLRWREVAFVPQRATSALDPVYRVGDQIVEAIRLHEPGTTREAATRRARSLLERVGVLPERVDDYAHELSGGTRQRVVLAMALACEPALLVADEPTTALDVVVQDRVLGALESLQERLGVAVLLVSHDVSVVASTAARVVVTYGGTVLEAGPTADVLERSANPYTLGLRNAFPSLRDTDRDLVSIPGTPPTLVDPDAGCRFRERCPFATGACERSHPPTYDVAAAERDGALEETTTRTHRSACHRLDEVETIRAAAPEEETWRATR